MQDLKTRLEIITGKKARVEKEALKVNVNSLDNIDIYNLNYFNLDKPENKTVKNLEIKRSGTGLVIILNFNKALTQQ